MFWSQDFESVALWAIYESTLSRARVKGNTRWSLKLYDLCYRTM